jgi:hypothetical protein
MAKGKTSLGPSGNKTFSKNGTEIGERKWAKRSQSLVHGQ